MNKLKKHIDMVVTDLDGTLLSDEKLISMEDLTVLEKLGEQGVLRVAATGRNLKKVHEVISLDVPFDYVLFSSGAGIYDWQKQNLVEYENLNAGEVRNLIDLFLEMDLSFKVNRAIPDNYQFFYHRGKETNEEFEWYLNVHKGHSWPFSFDRFTGEACQFLIIMPNDSLLFNKIKRAIQDRSKKVRVIKTTSPINGQFLWMEVFPIEVSKGHGLEKLCKLQQLSMDRIFCLGNDFNDIDMLEMTGYPMLVRNAHEELKTSFESSVGDNNNTPLLFALKKLNNILT